MWNYLWTTTMTEESVGVPDIRETLVTASQSQVYGMSPDLQKLVADETRKIAEQARVRLGRNLSKLMPPLPTRLCGCSFRSWWSIFTGSQALPQVANETASAAAKAGHAHAMGLPSHPLDESPSQKPPGTCSRCREHHILPPQPKPGACRRSPRRWPTTRPPLPARPSRPTCPAP